MSKRVKIRAWPSSDRLPKRSLSGEISNLFSRQLDAYFAILDFLGLCGKGALLATAF